MSRRRAIATARLCADHCIAYGEQIDDLPARYFGANGGWRAHCAHEYAVIAMRAARTAMRAGGAP